MQELVRLLEDLLARIRDAIARLDLAKDEAEITRLETEAQQPDFWNDPTKAAATSQQIASLRRHAEGWRRLESDVSQTLELAQTGDESLAPDLQKALDQASTDFAAREFELILSGPHDRSNAILEIHAGTGGTDAMDWAQMLERMYLRWAESHGYAAVILSESLGDEAGIKSVSIEINGPYAYGRLKGEGGTHRLVRLSPFNSDNLRQTSFALVEVLPQIDPDAAAASLTIDPKDLRVDVYRSSGHGGQSVNTTDSAVRLTYLPTGIVVTCQNERSQLQNKEKAMAVLRARLAAMLEEQHKAEIGELRSSDRSAAWGQQIRNYVLHPYTKVKDVRTGYETADAQAVLNGALDPFIEAYLKSQIGK